GGDAGLGAGFVHDVDGLVRQETRGQVAAAELHGGFERLALGARLVVRLVFGPEPPEDLDGILNAGLVPLDLLEAALERGVLLDVFAILVERGRADALHLATAEGGLEDVAGVHGALRAAGADDGVELVEEEDDILRAADLIHDGLDALLE